MSLFQYMLVGLPVVFAFGLLAVKLTVDRIFDKDNPDGIH